MIVPLPAEPNSDGWILFHRSGHGRFTAAETCAFRLPENLPATKARSSTGYTHLDEGTRRSALERLPDILQPPLADGGSTARLQP